MCVPHIHLEHTDTRKKKNKRKILEKSQIKEKDFEAKGK